MKKVNKRVRQGQPKETVQEEQEGIVETEGWDKEIFSHPQVIEREDVASSDSENDENNLPLDRGEGFRVEPRVVIFKKEATK
jgi:hypothetical protein